MAPLGLDSLPNELLTMVLSAVQTPGDLLAVIRASPQCYRIVNTWAVSFLEPLIRATIPPRNMEDALVACNLPTVIGTLSSHDPVLGLRGRPGVRGRITSILDHGGHGSQQLRLGDLPALWRLCRLCAVVDSFIGDYTRDVLPLAEAVLPGKQGGKGASPRTAGKRYRVLSGSERHRIQRALFRFEALRKFFALQRHTNYWNRGHSPSQSGFQQERAAIYVYLAERTERVIHGVEEILLKKAEEVFGDDGGREALARHNPAWVYRPRAKTSKIVNAGFLMQLKRSERARRQRLVETMTALGLPFLEHLFEASIEEQAAIISAYASVLQQGPDAGFDVVARRSGFHSTGTWPKRFTETPRRFNFGWLWATYKFDWARFDIDPSCFSYADELLRLGCVFWTKGRLEKLGFPQLTRLELEAIRCREKTTREPGLGETYARVEVREEWCDDLLPEPMSEGDERRLLMKLEYSKGNM